MRGNLFFLPSTHPSRPKDLATFGGLRAEHIQQLDLKVGDYVRMGRAVTAARKRGAKRLRPSSSSSSSYARGWHVPHPPTHVCSDDDEREEQRHDAHELLDDDDDDSPAPVTLKV